MDHRSIKRPRSEAVTAAEPTETGNKPTKTKKKQKKFKSGKLSKNGNEEKTSSSARVSMATADGQAMAQVLSTFNRMERVRFEAFKRSTFRGDAVSAYVAHCLAAAHERAYARGEKTRQLLGATNENTTNPLLRRCPYIRDETGNNGRDRNDTTSTSNGESGRRNGHPKRSLEDMVAPGQAEEITVVVSTLAKAYAQRLVTAARRVASSNGHENAALTSKDIMIAHQARVAAGLDPGFFLQARPTSAANVAVGNTKASAAALGVVNRYELERNAALAAQEAYDKQKQQEREATEAQEQVSDVPMEEEKQESSGDTLPILKDPSIEDVAMKESDDNQT